jgi:outer membrane receptor protein involved in Fe transport
MIPAVALQLLGVPAPSSTLVAQDKVQVGSIAGTVLDDRGEPIAGAQILIERPPTSTTSRLNGQYGLRTPPGSRMVRVRILGFQPDSAVVRVVADRRVTLNFALRRDPLQLQTLIVTGTQMPRQNLGASVAVTTLTAREIEQASPRSTTEVLRYVPGFTRVESSGGEVNQNISMRGILSQEYVMFMEDGMPVFPTMHTFFMNADNLFRIDPNIERMEVVRGGASALFGSNTPGAIINFINRKGGEEFGGVMRATAGTRGLARYDLSAGGPLGRDWQFSAGGFYRYDHGVRDPGFPGIRGGQLKANVTRVFPSGYVRASVKYIDDRNQFILPMPFTNPDDPDYVPGLSDYGSMNTPEGIDVQVPTPGGDLTLPLDNGLKTAATWFTVDAALDLANGWRLQNTIQAMQNDQEWNGIVPTNAFTVDQYVTAPPEEGGLGLPPGTTIELAYTNHFNDRGEPLPFETPNGLVAPGGQWYIDKPISAIQDQLQLRRTFGPHALALGAYVANYTQDNRWFFTDILTDVRDIPRFLDAVVTPPGGTPTPVTRNGFRKFLIGVANGTGQTSIFSGVAGGEVQLTERLRADLGIRLEHTDYVQRAENLAPFDLDGDSLTTFDSGLFGNNTFRHFSHGITDWAGSLGLNFALRRNLAVYTAAARGYKMPSLDEFLNAAAEDQVKLFDAQEVQSLEAGVKSQFRGLAFTVNGFYTKLRNVTTQGFVVDTVTNEGGWIVETVPETRSYGAEVEMVALPFGGLELLANGTILEAEFGSGTDIGSRLTGVPRTIGNVAAIYSTGGLELRGDFHWVASRFVDVVAGTRLPGYNYFNFGGSYKLPDDATRIDVDLLNAFQSTGLEEGNPRLLTAGTSPFFLARPILPRRVTVSLTYAFGGGRPSPP